ncbi:phenylacetic acid degradation protein PaaI [Halobacteriales archaeon QS_7_68_65]|nr:MAG: phenylacetic acid degradation protein PaaI [Halobacteriales archaeon QS_7_68_65]
MTADESAVETDVRERIASDPFCATLGIDLVDLGPASARTELAVTDELLNFHGTPHGGAVYSLAVATAEETHASGRTAEYEVVVTEDARDRSENRGDDDAARIATFRGRVYRP